MLKLQLLSPPEPTMVGKWVVRKLYDKERGFAHFYCPCGERWMSKDAWTEVRQRCKACTRARLPWAMWVEFAGDEHSAQNG